MPQPDHPEATKATPDTDSSFSPTRFFDDAYNKGIVNAVMEHPKEAALTAAVVAAGAAAAVLSRGRLLGGEVGGIAGGIERAESSKVGQNFVVTETGSGGFLKVGPLSVDADRAYVSSRTGLSRGTIDRIVAEAGIPRWPLRPGISGQDAILHPELLRSAAELKPTIIQGVPKLTLKPGDVFPPKGL